MKRRHDASRRLLPWPSRAAPANDAGSDVCKGRLNSHQQPGHAWQMNNPLEGLAGLPDEQKRRLEDAIEQMQVRDSLRMYNSLVEKCFKDCVESFRRKDLESTEEKCVQRCCEKFMKHSSRVGVRFAELSAAAEQQMQTITGSQQR